MADIPKIRFKGFTEPWEQRKVSELFKVTRGYVLAATLTEPTKTDEMPYPVYSSQTKDNGLMGYYKDYLYEDAITWTTDGANAGTVNYRAGKFYCTNVCGVLLSNEVTANQMIAEALNNVAKGYVSYVGNPKLMNNVMADIEIMIPTQAEEREKLSVFFCNLDHLITLHQRKCDDTKELKKYMLQKMFPKNGEKFPEIRFKGFTEAWEQRKFGELVDVYDGVHQTPDYQDSGIMFLSVENISTLKSNKYISTEAFERDYKVYPEKGDILMTRIGDIGTTNVVESTDKMAFYVSLALLKLKDIDSYFLSNAMKNEPFQKGLRQRSLLTAIPQKINKEEIGKTDIFITKNPVEQKKIGEYFSTLDHLITLHQRKCDTLKELKKYMLQNMFPKKG